jgi:hypothetical protein
VSLDDHTPAGQTRADLAVELLDRVDRRIADPNAVAVAQVHATLAVAEVLLDIYTTLADRHPAARRQTLRGVGAAPCPGRLCSWPVNPPTYEGAHR